MSTNEPEVLGTPVPSTDVPPKIGGVQDLNALEPEKED